jgi:hypothetical protein
MTHFDLCVAPQADQKGEGCVYFTGIDCLTTDAAVRDLVVDSVMVGTIGFGDRRSIVKIAVLILGLQSSFLLRTANGSFCFENRNCSNAKYRCSIHSQSPISLVFRDNRGQALFPAVRGQLSVDGCGRKVVLKDSGMEAADICSLQLLLSGEVISIVPP